ncbi:prepilin-type N-terminal cleavage/methylation domain-containing protein [Luteolibacter luteus]|uniref:Prepilin-type N-terminal cleavage/methylation domain-containing protein n=1 Tax=Luteolibacter luteus TaxID=2728835 RepID=A0A858RDG1_9BACT|nr:prepilin-type N-terminal cleavage/methylation domain-containing protein [Luteolibacter luteus]QJE94628.1 prepilin-type N-terminal cleavage/methylation domain-containing protein [Luteolibacter luteus]
MTSPKKRLLGGFSLIELLVVILIISLLLTLGAVGLRGITGGNGVGAAVATSEAVFDEARSIAVGKGTKSRVLVDINDPRDTENYLRRIVVAYQKLDEQGEPTEEWELASRALNLPEKTFFSKSYSKKDHEAGSGDIEEMTLTINKRAFDGRYLYYEFNSEGICTSPGSSFVVGSGIRPDGEEPRVTGDGKRDFAGFVIWRNGRTSLFRGPDQIGIPSDVTKF